MISEQPSQVIEPSPLGVQRPPSDFRRLDAVSAGWFFGWPLLVFVYLPLVTPGDAREACLLGAGSFLWFLSCYRIYALGRRDRISRTKIIVGWFFGWPPTLVVCTHLASLIEHPYWIDLSFIIPGTILWLASCYGIYDLLFTMAEVRWPAATTLREIVRSSVKMLLASRHHQPPQAIARTIPTFIAAKLACPGTASSRARLEESVESLGRLFATSAPLCSAETPLPVSEPLHPEQPRAWPKSRGVRVAPHPPFVRRDALLVPPRPGLSIDRRAMTRKLRCTIKD